MPSKVVRRILMKTVVTFLVVLCWTTVVAQTNSTTGAPDSPTSPDAESQVTPTAQPAKPVTALSTNERVKLQLDLPVPKDEHSLLDDMNTLTVEGTHTPTEANSEQAVMLRYFERLTKAAYMNPAPRPPDDLFSRSPITASKRKNPLALLNPIVWHISW
jgi:hypothetical protein